MEFGWLDDLRILSIGVKLAIDHGRAATVAVHVAVHVNASDTRAQNPVAHASDALVRRTFVDAERLVVVPQKPVGGFDQVHIGGILS